MHKRNRGEKSLEDMRVQKKKDSERETGWRESIESEVDAERKRVVGEMEIREGEIEGEGKIKF